MAQDRDFYAILGVSQDAGIDAIRKAYRKLVLRYHPDRNPDPGAAQLFFEIREAYDTLSDPDLREKYDRGLHGVASRAYGDVPHHPDPAYRPYRRHQAPAKVPLVPIFKRAEFYYALAAIVLLIVSQPVYDAIWRYNLKASGQEAWARIYAYTRSQDNRVTTVFYSFMADGSEVRDKVTMRRREFNGITALPSGLPLLKGHTYRVHYLPARPTRNYIDFGEPDEATVEDLQILTSLHLYSLPFDSTGRPDLHLLDGLADSVLARRGISGLSGLWKENDPAEILEVLESERGKSH